MRHWGADSATGQCDPENWEGSQVGLCPDGWMDSERPEGGEGWLGPRQRRDGDMGWRNYEKTDWLGGRGKNRRERGGEANVGGLHPDT